MKKAILKWIDTCKHGWPLRYPQDCEECFWGDDGDD